jgi:hypothetical protein
MFAKLKEYCRQHGWWRTCPVTLQRGFLLHLDDGLERCAINVPNLIQPVAKDSSHLNLLGRLNVVVQLQKSLWLLYIDPFLLEL